MMIPVILPFPATSQVCCIPQTKVLEKIKYKWHVRSIMSGEEVFQYMIKGTYKNYVLMGDTNEYYSDPSHRNME